MLALFRIGRLRNVQRFTTHVHSHCSANLIMLSLPLPTWFAYELTIVIKEYACADPCSGSSLLIRLFVQCLFSKLAKAELKSESLFLPFFAVQFVTELFHQERKTLLDHISKHCEERWKYYAGRSIFDELVWKRGQTPSGLEDIADLRSYINMQHKKLWN